MGNNVNINDYVVKALKNYEFYKASHNNEYEVILNVNENYKDFLNEELKEEFIEAIEKINLNRYPEPDNDSLVAIYAEVMNLKPENISATVGSDEGIRIISDTFLDAGEVAVTCVPTFSMYEEIANLVKAKLISIESEKEDLSPNIDKLIEVANEENAKVIYICSPNNPTGYVYKREDVKRIIDGTTSIIAVDEAYIDFADEGMSMLDFINYSNRVVILRTMSKAYAAAGLRVGFLIGSEDIIKYLNATRLPYNLSSLSAVATQVLLKNKALIDKEVHFIIQERERLIDILKQGKDIFVFDTKTNFILIRTPKAKEFFEKAKENSIVLRNFSKDNLIRITVGSKEENDRLIKVIKEVF